MRSKLLQSSCADQVRYETTRLPGGGSVEVVNSTPEPDGSFKTHFVRVPPECPTAREAVAWTFDMASEDYRPVMQT